jgi:hypothetical protein
MTEKDDDRLAGAIAADRVPDPPEDLAGRVVEAMLAAERAAPPRVTGRRWWPLAAAVAAGVALGGPFWLTLRSPGGGALGAGARRPSAQETIHLGQRAVLVAEAGADLRWGAGPEGAVLVEQMAGEVFYRVNAGKFLVETPAGVVRVTGTCFRVEVDDMKINRQSLSGAALGAALGAAVVVTVYEGRVLLAKGRSEVALEAGQRGQLTAGGVPQRLAADLPTPAGAATPAGGHSRPNVPRFDETESLRARIAEQDKELAQLRAPAAVAKKISEEKRRYLDPTKEELLARAERCELAFDTPPFSGYDAKGAQKLGLSEAEREVMNEVLREMKEQVITELRQLYLEMSGDAQMSERLSPPALESEMFARSPEGAGGRARAQIARERAGLVPPAADLSRTPVLERMLRLKTSVGDQFERKLAERFGPERARALRAREDGWSGKMVNSGCPDR